MLPLFVCHVDIQRWCQTTRISVAWARNKHTDIVLMRAQCVHMFGTPYRKVNTCIGQGSTRMLMTHYLTKSILRYSVVNRDHCCSVQMHNCITKTHCNNHCSNYFYHIYNQTGISHYSNNNYCKEQLSSKQRIIYENTGTNNSKLPSSKPLMCITDELRQSTLVFVYIVICQMVV